MRLCIGRRRRRAEFCRHQKYLMRLRVHRHGSGATLCWHVLHDAESVSGILMRHNQHALEIPAIQLQQRVRAELEAKAGGTQQ